MNTSNRVVKERLLRELSTVNLLPVFKFWVELGHCLVICGQGVRRRAREWRGVRGSTDTGTGAGTGAGTGHP